MTGMTELAQFLRTHDDYIVCGHVNPDGDALGTGIALTLALQSLGKRAFSCMPGGRPGMYAPFACSQEPFSGETVPFTPRTGFAVDISSRDRIGGRTWFDACEAKAVLDHHGTNEGFGDVSVIDGTAPACAELAVELIRELGVELTAEMATWLYIGLTTDTGRFSFSSTRPGTLIAAAECMRSGVDVDDVAQKLYRTRSEGHTRLLGRVLSQLEMTADGSICYSYASRADYEAAGAKKEDLDGIVNYLLEIRGVRIAILADERGDSDTKLSLRSKAPLDIAGGIARPLGGGGHMQAAGVSLKKGVREALETAVGMAREVLSAREPSTY